MLAGRAAEFEDDLPYAMWADALDRYVSGLGGLRLRQLGNDDPAALAVFLPAFAELVVAGEAAGAVVPSSASITSSRQVGSRYTIAEPCGARTSRAVQRAARRSGGDRAAVADRTQLYGPAPATAARLWAAAIALLLPDDSAAQRTGMQRDLASSLIIAGDPSAARNVLLEALDAEPQDARFGLLARLAATYVAEDDVPFAVELRGDDPAI